MVLGHDAHRTVSEMVLLGAWVCKHVQRSPKLYNGNNKTRITVVGLKAEMDGQVRRKVATGFVFVFGFGFRGLGFRV
jgi:hypothetical protein